MQISPRLRLAACAAFAVGMGVLAAVRVAPLSPTLEIKVRHVRAFRSESQSVYDLSIIARGGETIDEVRIELLRGAARIAPPGFTRNLAPGVRFIARVNVGGDTAVPPAVRITQKGRIDRTYDIELVEASR